MKALVTTACYLVFAGRLLAQFPQPQGPITPAADSLLFSAAKVAEDKVRIAKSMGPLFENLVVAYSMDHPFCGSLAYVRPDAQKVTAELSVDVKWITDAGRQCASFGHGAIYTALGNARLGKNYTLAIWIKLPVPTGVALIWEDMYGSLLTLKGEDIVLGAKAEAKTIGAIKPAPVGWHHVALTCDSQKTSVFFDGALKGAAPVAKDCRVHAIGGSISSSSGQCHLVDDMLVFDRALTPAEITTLGAFRLPARPPMPGEIEIVRESHGGAEPDFRLPPPPPPSPEVATAVAELVKTYRSSLVFGVTRDGVGSGFLASYAKGNFLFTNAHIAIGARGAPFLNLDGAKVPVGAASIAVGHDIFLQQASALAHPLEVMTEVDQHAAIGDDIVVLDNRESVGPVDTIMGKIVGVGPNLVEVDAPFVNGNSGSPIVHVKSGKVIGVATYLTTKKFDPATKELLATPEIRRFGYRLDSVKSWQPVNAATFWAQAQEMEAIETLTADLIKFANDVRKNHKVSPDLHTNPTIKPHIDTYAAQTRDRASEKDTANAMINLLAYLKTACRTDIVAAQQHLTYDFFQRKLADEQRDREALADIFDKTIKDIH